MALFKHLKKCNLETQEPFSDILKWKPWKNEIKLKGGGFGFSFGKLALA